MLIYVTKKSNKDTFKNDTKIEKKYITVGALAGLNNRIQVILSYLYLAKSQGKKLNVIWITDEQCPEKFDDLFYPIEDVNISYEPIEESLYDYKNWDKENNKYIEANYYSLLKPVVNIQNKIDDIKKLLAYDSKNYIACHIRRTDALTHELYKFYIKDDEEYINFINNIPDNLKIYIATDCKLTQQKFIDLYGDRMIYKKIKDSTNLRQTSLEDAVIDMYVCSGSKYFMRSYGSFSNTIEYIRNIGNEHYDPDFKTYEIDGDEIYQQATDQQHSEHSRFNYVKKECSHWYCLEFMNSILSPKNNIKYKNVLVLGVALGGQIIHLLNKDPTIRVTGVDIDDVNFHIVKKFSDNRLRLIKDDAYNYIMTTNDTYDVIICDIFIGMHIADFVLTPKFLNKINIMLVSPNSKFLLNTTSQSDKNEVNQLLNKFFKNSSIELIHNPRYVNNLYLLTKIDN
jgi:hypothetical protein